MYYACSRLGIAALFAGAVAFAQGCAGTTSDDGAAAESDLSAAIVIPPTSQHPYECGTHEACRQGFLDAFEVAKARTPSAEHSILSLPQGDGTTLPIDVAFFPAARNPNRRVLVLTSGIHGLEGFTGSSLQQLFMRESLPRALSAEVDVLVVHGINAWGMKNYRRVTQNRVDLNRNWFLSDEFPSGTDDASYDDFRSVFEPEGRASFSTWDFTQFIGTSLVPNLTSARNGALTKAAGQGQYRYPQGISFGGKGYEPHRALVVDALMRYVKGHHSVMAVDLHTGLGRRQLQLLPNPPKTTDLAQRQKAIFEVAGHTIESTGGSTFYSSHGDFSDFVCEYSQARLGASTCTNMLVEFGTVMPAQWEDDRLFGSVRDMKSSAYLLYLTIRENQMFHHGANDIPTIAAVRDEWTHMFRPQDSAWYEMVVDETRLMLPQWVERFASLQGEP